LKYINSIKDIKDIVSNYSEINQALSDGASIYIWGLGNIGRQVLRCFTGLSKSERHVILWDIALNGKVINGMDVHLPSTQSLTMDEKHTSIFIVAIQDVNTKFKIVSELQSNGCRNIISGADFIKYYPLRKALDDYYEYSQKNTDPIFAIDDNELMIFFNGWYYSAGSSFDDLYLNQDLWAAKKVYTAKPELHYDVGSRVDGFITHLLSFEQKVVMIDIRPLETFSTENISFIQADATTLDGIPDNSVESMSALCSPEHFGLGRYGDPIDPNAHLKFFRNMRRVLKKGGNIYLSVQVGTKSKLVFNAHRVFTPRYVVERFQAFDLVEFSMAVKNKGIIKNIMIDDAEVYYDESKDPLGTHGFFHFRK
jgi:SAM-dependent methyltransferase